MRVTVETIDRQQEEQVLIRCHEVTDTVREIRHFILSRQESLEGYEAGKQFQIPLPEIYYAEAVDNRLFIYTEEKVYEVKMKLYAFEEAYGSKQFFRCSRTADRLSEAGPEWPSLRQAAERRGYYHIQKICKQPA